MARVSSVSPASLAPIGAWPEHVVGATWRWHPMLLHTQRELSEGLPGPRRPRAGSLTSQLTVCVGRRRSPSGFQLAWPPRPPPRGPRAPASPAPGRRSQGALVPLGEKGRAGPGCAAASCTQVCALTHGCLCDGGGGHPRPASRPVLRRPDPVLRGPLTRASRRPVCWGPLWAPPRRSGPASGAVAFPRCPWTLRGAPGSGRSPSASSGAQSRIYSAAAVSAAPHASRGLCGAPCWAPAVSDRCVGPVNGSSCCECLCRADTLSRLPVRMVGSLPSPLLVVPGGC